MTGVVVGFEGYYVGEAVRDGFRFKIEVIVCNVILSCQYH